MTATAINSRLGLLQSVCCCCLEDAAPAMSHTLKNNGAILILLPITKPCSICVLLPAVASVLFSAPLILLWSASMPVEPHVTPWLFALLDGLRKTTEFNDLCLRSSFSMLISVIFTLRDVSTLSSFTLLYAEPSVIRKMSY